VEDQLTGSVDAGSGTDGVGCVEVEVLLLVMPLGERRLNFVAEAEVDGEAGIELPVVLNISAEVVLLGCELSIDAGRSGVVGNAEKVRREAKAGSLGNIGRIGPGGG